MTSLNQCSSRMLLLSGAETFATADAEDDDEEDWDDAAAWEEDAREVSAAGAAVPLMTAVSRAVRVFFPARPSCFRPERLWNL